MLSKLTKNDLKATPIAPSAEQRDATPDEKENTWEFKLKENFTDIEIETLFPPYCLRNVGWFEKERKDAYTAIAACCEKQNLHALQYFSVVRDRKVHIYAASDVYPIFLIHDEHKIIYQPFNPDEHYRYVYPDKMPASFVHGVTQIKKQTKEILKRLSDEADGEPIAEKDAKVGMAILVPEPADAFGLALLLGEKVKGHRDQLYYPVYLSGTKPEFTKFDLIALNQDSKAVYQVWNPDEQARQRAHIVALEHLDILNIELPPTVKIKTDIPQQQYKLFESIRDYFTWQNAWEFGELLTQAMPYRFWDMEARWKGPKDKRERDGWKYEFKSTQAYNFLNKMGFFRLPVEGKTEYIYIYKDGNIIRERAANKVKNFIHEFLEQRRVDIALRDELYGSPRLNEASLSNLKETTIDFTDHNEYMQLFFFDNGTLEVRAEKIIHHAPGALGQFVWERDVIKHDISVDPEQPFTITENVDGKFDIKVNHYKCLFFNYLIQTSRIHWRRELEVELPKLSIQEQEAYHRDHKFEIDSHLLSAEERWEQKQHLLNKIFALGYIFHRHKVRSKAWAVVGTDDKISNDGKSHGGSGKSIAFSQAPEHVFNNIKVIPGTDPGITKTPHIFHGLTSQNQLMVIDDADKYLNFRFFFEFITNRQVVNNKNGDIFAIPFEQLCKMVWLTNFSFTTDPSTERRILYVVFSDYYHQKSEANDYKESRSPVDDMGKELFDQFDAGEYNLFYNTIARCVQFFLKCPVKLSPPMSSVNKRKLLREMGVEFEAWASLYFSAQAGNLNRLIVKDEALQEFKRALDNKSYTITSTQFKRAIEAFCKFNGYIFNPEELINDKKDNRIVKIVPERTLDRNGEWLTSTKKTAKELFYIQNEFDVELNLELPGIDAPLDFSKDRDQYNQAKPEQGKIKFNKPRPGADEEKDEQAF